MSDRSIRDAVRQMTGDFLADKVYVMDAVVNSVDETARTCVCQVVSGRAQNEIPDVRLMSSVDDGILIIPEVGSTVCIIVSDYTEPYVSQYSAVEKIIIRGGDLGGLVKVITLTEKINNLEKLVNDLIAKFNAHTHNVTAVAAPTGPNLNPETQTLTITQQSEIENKLVTHG